LISYVQYVQLENNLGYKIQKDVIAEIYAGETQKL